MKTLATFLIILALAVAPNGWGGEGDLDPGDPPSFVPEAPLAQRMKSYDLTLKRLTNANEDIEPEGRQVWATQLDGVLRIRVFDEHATCVVDQSTPQWWDRTGVVQALERLLQPWWNLGDRVSSGKSHQFKNAIADLLFVQPLAPVTGTPVAIKSEDGSSMLLTVNTERFFSYQAVRSADLRSWPRENRATAVDGNGTLRTLMVELGMDLLGFWRVVVF